MKRIKVLIKGDVTGVFFRKFIYENAIKLNIKGYVKNINNNVEAVFIGDEININKILDLCKKGSIGAKVASVEIQETKENFNDFRIIY